LLHVGSNAQTFCFRETAHHSTDTFKAMLLGFLEAVRLAPRRRTFVDRVFAQLDLARRQRVTRTTMREFGEFLQGGSDGSSGSDERGLSECQLDALMGSMDLDGDGLVSYHEFLAYFAKVNETSSHSLEVRP